MQVGVGVGQSTHCLCSPTSQVTMETQSSACIHQWWGFLSVGQTSGWNASDHCSWCYQNLAWSMIFSALFSNNWILNFPHLHLPVSAVIVTLHSEDFAFSTFTFHRYKNLNVICALDGLSSCSRYSVWSSPTALFWGILVCVFRLESRMWGFGNPLSQPCLSDDRNPI